MKLYNKNGELSTPAFLFCGILASADFGAIAGELMVLFCCAVWGEPVPMLFQTEGWVLLALNASILLAKLHRENRKIRVGVIPPEIICAIMEKER